MKEHLPLHAPLDETGVASPLPKGDVPDLAAVESLEAQVAVLKAENERLEEAQRATAAMWLELVSGLSHELSQPLSAIIAYTSAQRHLLGAGAVSPAELENGLQRTAEQAERAAEFIRRLRGLIRRSLPQPKRCSIGVVAVRALGRLDAALRQANVQVHTRGLETAPDAWVDAEQMQQIFIQLLCNCIEALESSSSETREIAIEAQQLGEVVEITVRNTGRGFAAEELDSIFMPFVSTKRDHLGLGLSLARSLVDAQHGRLWAETEQNGAVIKFVVPVAQVEL